MKLLRSGTYPGSLGNYAGVDLNIPVITIELASAGTLPPSGEVRRMWIDLVRWLKREVPKQRLMKLNE
ncbi:peptidase M14, carboxypeptidase A [gamma proteobacterium IMCC1989]|nr:peptidase M14, carboxypeptidase A [gamma proteobacterium IMCC1989]